MGTAPLLGVHGEAADLAYGVPDLHTRGKDRLSSRQPDLAPPRGGPPARAHSLWTSQRGQLPNAGCRALPSTVTAKGQVTCGSATQYGHGQGASHVRGGRRRKAVLFSVGRWPYDWQGAEPPSEVRRPRGSSWLASYTEVRAWALVAGVAASPLQHECIAPLAGRLSSRSESVLHHRRMPIQEGDEEAARAIAINVLCWTRLTGGIPGRSGGAAAAAQWTSGAHVEACHARPGRPATQTGPQGAETWRAPHPGVPPDDTYPPPHTYGMGGGLFIAASVTAVRASYSSAATRGAAVRPCLGPGPASAVRPYLGPGPASAVSRRPG